METSYKVSEGIQELFMRSHALLEMAKQASDNDKAIEYTVDSIRIRRNAWKMVYAELPEVNDSKQWTYSTAGITVTLKEREYPITEEIRALFEQAREEETMRDAILGSAFFLFRRAVASAHNKRSHELTKTAWEKVTELYPETEDTMLVWGERKGSVVRTK